VTKYDHSINAADCAADLWHRACCLKIVMMRFLLASIAALLLGSMAAFFFFVSLVSIATVVCILVGFVLMFGLGVQIAIGKTTVNDHGQRGLR
jgi:hypothetical protein